ncbi:TPA: hypothetical protein SIC36_001254 [Pasteurella multocida]|nr:hypothetical protein [Pasteurella multocida]HEH9666949.1 hypothetical protein [Pasteurella multocida]HEH9823608.1 hypothetical protein [Pasteurella multocida]
MKMKDAGTQSYIWSVFSGLLAWLGDQQNLMMVSLAIGIVTALVNLSSKFHERRVRIREEARKLKTREEERKIRIREEERKEELHRLHVERLRKGLDIE